MSVQGLRDRGPEPDASAVPCGGYSAARRGARPDRARPCSAPAARSGSASFTGGPFQASMRRPHVDEPSRFSASTRQTSALKGDPKRSQAGACCRNASARSGLMVRDYRVYRPVSESKEPEHHLMADRWRACQLSARQASTNNRSGSLARAYAERRASDRLLAPEQSKRGEPDRWATAWTGRGVG